MEASEEERYPTTLVSINVSENLGVEVQSNFLHTHRMKKEQADDECCDEWNYKKMAARKRTQQLQPSECVICGSPTSYHHYDVASCNGCRTFFRRTLLLRRTYHCTGYGQCSETWLRNCRACRFDRCILAGMNAEAVKLPSRDTFALARAIGCRRLALIEGRSKPFECISAKAGIDDCRALDYLRNLETRAVQVREQYDPVSLYSIGLRDLLDRALQWGSIEHFKLPTNVGLFKSGIMSAFVMPSTVDSFRATPLDFKPANMGRFVLGTDLFVFVELAKSVPAFREMTLDDQMIMLKEVAMASLMLVRIMILFNRRSSVIAMLGEDQLTEKSGMESEVYERPLEPFERVRPTFEEMVLIKCLVYTSSAPSAMSSQGKQMLSQQRDRFADLLLRHLQRTNGSVVGAARYAEVLSLVDACFHFGKKYREHCTILNLLNPNVLPKFGLISDIFWS